MRFFSRASAKRDPSEKTEVASTKKQTLKTVHRKNYEHDVYTEKIMNMTHHVTKMNAKKDGNTNGEHEVHGDGKEYIK